ncbi:unnamed protein product, partial [Pleuronectes platessa]
MGKNQREARNARTRARTQFNKLRGDGRRTPCRQVFFLQTTWSLASAERKLPRGHFWFKVERSRDDRLTNLCSICFGHPWLYFKTELLSGPGGFGLHGGASAASAAQQMQKREKSFGIQMLSVQPDTKPKGCAGCNRKIKDRYLLKALDKYWHEDCLKCACCDCRLGEVGSTLYTKANLILCRRDYLR